MKLWIVTQREPLRKPDKLVRTNIWLVHCDGDANAAVQLAKDYVVNWWPSGDEEFKRLVLDGEWTAKDSGGRPVFWHSEQRSRP